MYINSSSTDARVNWFQMLKNIKKQHKVYRIASKHGDAVLLSQEDYESLLESIESIPHTQTNKVNKRVNKSKKEQSYSLKIVYLKRNKNINGG